MRRSTLLLTTVLAFLLVAAVRSGVSAAEPPKEAADAPPPPVEYKFVPGSELGITGGAGNGVFDYPGATKRLNDLAKDGWRVRAVIAAGGPSGIVMEREPTGAGRALGEAGGPVIEAGKHYTFYWERGLIVDAVALAAPRGNWVKVRYQIEAGKEAVHWVNLATVTYLIELPAK